MKTITIFVYVNDPIFLWLTPLRYIGIELRINELRVTSEAGIKEKPFEI